MRKKFDWRKNVYFFLKVLYAGIRIWKEFF